MVSDLIDEGPEFTWKDVLEQFTGEGDDYNFWLQLALKLKKRGHCSSFPQAEQFCDAVAFLYQLTNEGKLMPRPGY